MDVAIVGGTGDEGFGLALRLTTAGVRVTIGSRVLERAQDAADRVCEAVGKEAPVGGAENPDAVSAAGLVFVTVPYVGQAATYRSLKEAWPRGVIVCDTTTPLASAVGGSATQVLRPWHGSAAEQARSMLPEEVPLVSGLHSVGAEPLTDLSNEVDSDALLCGDDPEAKAVVGEMVERIPGMRWVDCGPLEMARVLEPLTALLIRVNKGYGVTGAGIRFSGRDGWGRR
ncbi:MAG: NADPH-dependent F420 reductase [Nocardioidaceae bacterium]